MLVSRIFDRAVGLIIRAKIAADTDSMVKATTTAASVASKTVRVTETKTETRNETKTETSSGSESATVTLNESTSSSTSASSSGTSSTSDSESRSETDNVTNTVTSEMDRVIDENVSTTGEESESEVSNTRGDRSIASDLDETVTTTTEISDTQEHTITNNAPNAENVTLTTDLVTNDEDVSESRTTQSEGLDSEQYQSASSATIETSSEGKSVTMGEVVESFNSTETTTDQKTVTASGESETQSSSESTQTQSGESESSKTTASESESDAQATNDVEAEITTVTVSETSGVELFPKKSEEAKKAYIDAIMSDYTERAPYIVAALVSEAAQLDKCYRETFGLPEQPSYDSLEISLQSEFPLCDRFVSPAVNYIAALLILDDNTDLYERLFEKWSNALYAISAEIPAKLHAIVNRYPVNY